jgi:hypothetical protein
MKTIVFVNGEKHSAWHSKEEAKNQVRVLINHGYRDVTWDYIDHNYENGHYFV